MKAYINIICFFTEMLLGIALVANQTLFQTVCDYFNVAEATMWIGFFTSAFFVGLVVVAIISGELSEHIGKKNVVAIFSFIVVAGTLMLTVAPSKEFALFSIFVLGLGFGAVEGQINGIIIDENSTSSSKIMNFAAVFFAIGAILSPMLVSNYIVSGGTWQSVYFIIAILYAILGIMFFIAKPKKKPAMKKQSGVASFKLIRKIDFLIPCILIFIYIGAENVATSWNVNIFGSTQFGAWALAIFWAAMGVSRFVAGFVKESNLQRFITIQNIIGIIGFAGIILFNQYEIPVLICFFVVGFGLGPIWPSCFAVGLNNAGKYSGAGSGVIMTFSSLGGVVLSLVVGVLSGFSIMVAGIVFLAAIILIQRIYLHAKKQ